MLGSLRGALTDTPSYHTVAEVPFFQGRAWGLGLTEGLLGSPCRPASTLSSVTSLPVFLERTSQISPKGQPGTEAPESHQAPSHSSVHVSHLTCPSHLQCPFPYLFNSNPCSSSRTRQESRCLGPQARENLAPSTLMVILWAQVRILCACKFLLRLSASVRETSSYSSPGPGHIVITKYNECKGTKEQGPAHCHALVKQQK